MVMAITARKKTARRYIVSFRVRCTTVPKGGSVRLVGSVAALGNWNPASGLIMSSRFYPIWEASVDLSSETDPDDDSFSLQYKYIITTPQANSGQPSVVWEVSPNRTYKRAPRKRHHSPVFGPLPPPGSQYQPKQVTLPDVVVTIDDDPFVGPQWRGAGISAELASIRSKEGMGVGEFNDIKYLVDWAEMADLSVIQLTPMHDTAINKPLPDAPISVFAWHPIYLHLTGLIEDAEISALIQQQTTRLNNLKQISYSDVLQTKMLILRRIFDAKKAALANDADLSLFIDQNREWLAPYSEWKEKELHPEYDEVSPDAFLFYSYIQFQLHKQLLAISVYARAKHVALHMEIPVSVHPSGVDILSNPQLFRPGTCIGLPPSPSCPLGMNTQLPVPDWEGHLSQGFQWWSMRLERLAIYFQGICLRNVSVYFRCLEVLPDAASGELGTFIPHVPINRVDLERRGVQNTRDLEKPFITDFVVTQVVGGANRAAEVSAKLLERATWDSSSAVRYQPSQDILFCSPDPALEPILSRLTSNVLLIPLPDGVVPRSMMEQNSYGVLDTLDRTTRDALKAAHDEYYYGERNTALWKFSGIERLRKLKSMTAMLITAEDKEESLTPFIRDGLIQMQIPLETQIIYHWDGPPSVKSGPHWTIASTSSVSRKLLRCWWEEHRDTQSLNWLYRDVLGLTETPPHYCESTVVQRAVLRCLESPCALALIPLQDMLAVQPEFIQGLNPADEQMSRVGAWNYRLGVEAAAIGNSPLFTFIRALVRQTTRSIQSSA